MVWWRGWEMGYESLILWDGWMINCMIDGERTSVVRNLGMEEWWVLVNDKGVLRCWVNLLTLNKKLRSVEGGDVEYEEHTGKSRNLRNVDFIIRDILCFHSHAKLRLLLVRQASEMLTRKSLARIGFRDLCLALQCKAREAKIKTLKTKAQYL